MNPIGLARGAAAALLGTALIVVAAGAGTPRTVLVSASTDGLPGGGNSYSTAISADGRYVVFESGADNLVPGDTNGQWDVFVRDRRTGTTTMADVSSTGAAGGSISADGRYVAFASGTTISVRDRRTGTTRQVADGSEAMISGNGRYLVYSAGDPSALDVFRADLRTGTIVRVPAGAVLDPIDVVGPKPLVSADGGLVAYTVAGVVFGHDFRTGSTRRITPATSADARAGAISADGRFVVFSAGEPGALDVYRYDLRTGRIRPASVSGTGQRGDGMSFGWMTTSGDGRYVGFGSVATNLVPGDTNGLLDVFVHDFRTGRTVRVSDAADGGEPNGESLAPVLSADGRQVAFTSLASNLVSPELPLGNQNVFATPLG